jgi:hypothetical protein
MKYKIPIHMNIWGMTNKSKKEKYVRVSRKLRDIEGEDI